MYEDTGDYGYGDVLTGVDYGEYGDDYGGFGEYGD